MTRLKANDQMAAHEALFDHPRCPRDFQRISIVQDIQAGQYATAQERLQRAYKRCFELDDDDFRFLVYLASMRNQISRFTPIARENDAGEIESGWTQTLLQGHGAVRDFFDANIEGLLEADLIYYPRIDGRVRKRLIYKPYYCLSSEALDCIDKRVQGPGIGDLGESVTHSLGCRLAGEYLRHGIEEQTGDTVRVEFFVSHLVDGHTVDVVVLKNNPDLQAMEPYAVVEVETGLNREREVLADFAKLGQVDCPEKVWVAPTRKLVNQMLNVILLRNWFDIDPVPEELPLLTGEGTLQNTNCRLRSASFTPETVQWAVVPYTPVTRVLSYLDMYDIIKNQYDPTMFDTPRV